MTMEQIQPEPEDPDPAITLAEAGGLELDRRTLLQNDFIWLCDRRVATGQITPLQAKLAFRDYSNFLDAVQAMENGSSNAV